MSAGVPADFVWGVATAAYQVEGAADADGRGESIWDRFCATPGKVRAGDSGAVACDFYHRYPQDVGLMRELGVDAFRFSVAWPRVLPDGRGRVNEAGLDFYDRLVDALLDAGIRPFVTLYHWDLPQRIEDVGGWPERGTADAFAEFAEVVAGRLGDRVDHWTTQNEPYIVAWLGYGRGEHAPGRASSEDAVAASHHVLLAHGLAVNVLREASPGAEVGITLDLWPVHRAHDTRADAEAAQQVDGLRNRWFLDPLFRAEYPADTAARLAPPPVRDGDMALIATPVDFLGVNVYSRSVVQADPRGAPVHVLPQRRPLTDAGWEVYPPSIYEVLTRVAADYGPAKLYVTENGAAFADVRTHDGEVHDLERVDFLAGYVAEVERAVAEGVPVAGYFVWSLLDNFEWAHGYSKRFGIVYVDYPTLERVPKDSFYWYRDHIARRRASARHEPVAVR
jgi:beta-glucosidase